ESPMPEVSSADAGFLREAAIGGLEEVKLGKLAAEKASDPEIRKFGEMMVSDHTAVNTKLGALAQEKALAISSDLDAERQADVDKLSKLSGADFDREYVKEMVRDHEKDLAKFEAAAKDAKDPAVRSFAADALPTLRAHLEKIREIAAKQFEK